MKKDFLVPIIGLSLFISGTISNFLIWSSPEGNSDIYLVTIGISVSGLVLIGGSFMYLWFGKKK